MEAREPGGQGSISVSLWVSSMPGTVPVVIDQNPFGMESYLICVVLKAHVGFLGRDRLFLRAVTSFVSFIIALPILRRCGDGQVAVTEPILGAVL